jgi:glycerophosphoryl diester phosphodiesterase
MVRYINKKIWIIAHRGAMAEAPENTGAAFKKALESPIDGIEFDVQMTKDSIPVLYHNRTLAKVNKSRRRISDCTYRELSGIDWGGWFSRFFKGERLLTLLRALKVYSIRTRLLVEIKSRKKDKKAGRSIVLASKVQELIKENVPKQYHKSIFILSFDINVIEFLLNRAPDSRYVLNLKKSPSEINKLGKINDGLYGFCVPVKNLEANFVRAAHSRGKKIMTYSCNTMSQVYKALDMNVDVIMTDRPAWLIGSLKKHDIICR